MHDLLYARLAEWSALPPDEFRATLSGYAGELGLDVEQFDADLDTGKYAAVIQVARDAAASLGASQTPTTFFNELQYDPAGRSTDELDLIVQVVLLRVKYAEAPPLVIDPEKSYNAWIVAAKGDIALDLFPEIAPQTVNNFVYLACVGYYDNVTFHRVIPDFVAQAGDPTGTGVGGPGYTLVDEAPDVFPFDRAGWLSMARANQPDSARGQFFITLAPATHLDGKGFTIFGEVVGGWDVVESLTPRDPQRNPLAPPGDAILTVIVREN
jgi:cyclophilin family peptidyl-prolyl cis-trans isomerase